ncbi:hypothetical protein M758_10G172200 [Ceratodon purpureus]|nr:hypothetical protein M758_10G172200 [Ceratodon purpureus]
MLYQVAQQSVSKLTQGMQPMKLNFGSNSIAPKPVKEVDQVTLSTGRSLEQEMEAWRRNSRWVDEAPSLEVKVPKEAFCEVNSQFKIGLPPDAVWNILIDPGNKRVFKNIQEVIYRKVLEDDGYRQLVEVDQAAVWKFLWFSGTLSVCVLVDQDRRKRLMNYKLAKQGFMKQFDGTWKVEPLYIDAEGSPAPEDVADRVASVVSLQQVVQPAVVPPPPFKSYVRGITTRTTEMLLQDLQAEGKRLRETSFENLGALPEKSHINQNQEVLPEDSDYLKKSTGSRRKARKSRWRLKDDSSP